MDMQRVIKKEIELQPLLFGVLGVITFTLLTALGAFIRIPLFFTPVPLTLQTTFVLLAGMVLKANKAALSQFLYIFLGILGLPIFAGYNRGILYLTGPSGGYLLGFILASFLVGKLIHLCKTNKAVLGLLIFADGLILACGGIWLSFLLGGSLKEAFRLGVMPFLVGDLLKISAAFMLYLKIRNWTDEFYR